jgi:hypothetical protein
MYARSHLLHELAGERGGRNHHRGLVTGERARRESINDMVGYGLGRHDANSVSELASTHTA